MAASLNNKHRGLRSALGNTEVSPLIILGTSSPARHLGGQGISGLSGQAQTYTAPRPPTHQIHLLLGIEHKGNATICLDDEDLGGCVMVTEGAQTGWMEGDVPQ